MHANSSILPFGCSIMERRLTSRLPWHVIYVVMFARTCFDDMHVCGPTGRGGNIMGGVFEGEFNVRTVLRLDVQIRVNVVIIVSFLSANKNTGGLIIMTANFQKCTILAYALLCWFSGCFNEKDFIVIQ